MSQRSWKKWLSQKVPHVAQQPLAKRHVRLWNWFDGIKNGDAVDPIVEIWPRGGGKSTSAELGVAYLADDPKPAIRLVLYVCDTQEQADRHVQSIASILEHLEISRSVNKYGHSKGWRRDQLRTTNGFTVAGIGLDTAARGVKFDEFRPDLMVFDDVDGGEDTPKTTAKKIRSITKALIPAGAANCRYLFIQNLIRDDGILAQLYDGRADWLMSRTMFLEVAVEGLKTKIVACADGKNRYSITDGKATWRGQNLEICERQINEWGLRAFLEEAQHEIAGVGGYFFTNDLVEIVEEYPELTKVVRAWDFAATQGGGDFTVGVLMGISTNKVCWILDVVRAQLSPDHIKTLMGLVREWDLSRFGAKYTLRTPQDPGAAGKRAAGEDRKDFGAKTETITGKKHVRAKDYAATWNVGNIKILKDGSSRTPEIDSLLETLTRRTELDGKTLNWNAPLLGENRRFREDGTHDFDDQVDAGADAYNELAENKQVPKWEVY